MAERTPNSKELPREILMSRFYDPKRLGSLSEEQFNQAVRQVLKPLPEKDKEAAFEKYRIRWKHLHETAKVPAVETPPKETSKAVHGDFMSWADFKNAFEQAIPAGQWDQIAEMFGSPTTAEQTFYEPATDLTMPTEQSIIRVQLTENGTALDATFLKPLGKDAEGLSSYLVELKQSKKTMEVTADMILVPRTPLTQTEEEILEVIAPEPERNVVDRFKLGDHIVLSVMLPDGTTRTISGVVMLAGIHEERLKAAVYSHDLPEADQRIVVVEQSALQLAKGEELSRAIERETGFSPREPVEVSRTPGEIYRVVGTKIEAGVTKLELVPKFLFTYSLVRDALKRIEAIRLGTEPKSPTELEDLHNSIRAVFEPQTIWEPIDQVKTLRKTE